jgi:hypothetical protein
VASVESLQIPTNVYINPLTRSTMGRGEEQPQTERSTSSCLSLVPHTSKSSHQSTEDTSIPERINPPVHARKRVRIPDLHGVQLPVIDAKPHRPIWFGYQHDWTGSISAGIIGISRPVFLAVNVRDPSRASTYPHRHRVCPPPAVVPPTRG